MRQRIRWHRTVLTGLFLLAAWPLVASSVLAAGPTRVHNRSNYDLWVCVGRTIDKSFEGVTDPNARLIAEGWFPLRRGGTFNLPPESYAIFVAAIRDGRMMPVPIEDPRPQYPNHVFSDYSQPAPFPIRMGQFKANVPLRFRPNDRVNAIRQAGFEPQNFYPSSAATGFEYAVGVTDQSRRALDGFFR